MDFLKKLFRNAPENITKDMCMPLKIENIPSGLEIRVHDNTMVEGSFSIGDSCVVTFINEGAFRTHKDGENRDFYLVNPPTPIYITFNGQEVFGVGQMDADSDLQLEATAIKGKVKPVSISSGKTVQNSVIIVGDNKVSKK